MFYPDAVNEKARIDVYDSPAACSIQPEYNLLALLKNTVKQDLIALITNLFKRSESAKRFILQWFSAREKND